MNRKVVEAAAKRIIKNAVRNCYDGLSGMFPSVSGENTFYCVCDSFRAVRFYNELRLGTASGECYGKPLNLEKLCKPAENAFEIDLPSTIEIRAAMYDISGKRTDKPMCINEEIGLYVNPKYLLDMIQCLPGAHVYARGPIDQLYFKAENGDGILLPCIPPRK